MSSPCDYIMVSQRNGAPYVGVTSYLSRRVYEHRNGWVDGFTRRYGRKMLVWRQLCERMEEAIAREKQLK